MTYDAKYLEAKRALAVDAAFDDPSERRHCLRSGHNWFLKARASNHRRSTILQYSGSLVHPSRFFLRSQSVVSLGGFGRSVPGGHRFGEVCIQCGAEFFEPDLVYLHLLLLADREGLHALQNTNQPVYILVPQIEFSKGIHFHESRFAAPTLRSRFRRNCSSTEAHPCWTDLQLQTSSPHLHGSSRHSNSLVVGALTTWSVIRRKRD